MVGGPAPVATAGAYPSAAGRQPRPGRAPAPACGRRVRRRALARLRGGATRRAVAPIRPEVDPCAPPAAPPAMPERPGRALPGTTKPRRFRPRFHYELLACGLAGHELVGTDAARAAPAGRAVAREGPTACAGTAACAATPGCRCAPPEHPARALPPTRDEIELPLRGQAAARQGRAAAHRDRPRAALRRARGRSPWRSSSSPPTRAQLRAPAYRVLADLQGGARRPDARPRARPRCTSCAACSRCEHGTLMKIGARRRRLRVAGGGRGGRALVSAALGRVPDVRRHDALLPLEIYELAHTLSPLKLVTLVINVAVVVYLLLAKRLFGLRGGARPSARSASATSAGPRSSAPPPGRSRSRRERSGRARPPRGADGPARLGREEVRRQAGDAEDAGAGVRPDDGADLRDEQRVVPELPTPARRRSWHRPPRRWIGQGDL